MKIAVNAVNRESKATNNKKSAAVTSALVSTMLTLVSGFVNFAHRLNFDGVSREICAVLSLVTLTFYITTAVFGFAEKKRGVIIYGLFFWSVSLVGAILYSLQVIFGTTLDTLPLGVAFTRIIYALLTLPVTAYNAIIEAAGLYIIKLVLAFLPTLLFLAFYVFALVSALKKRSEE